MNKEQVIKHAEVLEWVYPKIQLLRIGLLLIAGVFLALHITPGAMVTIGLLFTSHLATLIWATWLNYHYKKTGGDY